MANVNVKTTRLDLNTPGEIKFSSATASDTIYFDYNAAGDEKLVMLFKGAGSLTLKKGNAIQGVVNVGGTVTTEAAVRVDSGLFKNVYGSYTGKVSATVSATTNVALVQLP